MSRKLVSAALILGAVIFGVLVWVGLPVRETRSVTQQMHGSDKRSLPSVTRRTDPVPPSRSNTGIAKVTATAGLPGNLPAEEVRLFRLYTSVARFYEPATADKLQLSDDERMAINFVAWQYRNRLNALIANEAVVRFQNDQSITVSFALDAATADRLQADFIDDLRGAVGDARLSAIEHSSLLSEIDMHLDHWGRSPTAYSIKVKRSDAENRESIVSIDVLSDKNPLVVRSSAFPQSIFASMYGPVAKKIGL